MLMIWIRSVSQFHKYYEPLMKFLTFIDIDYDNEGKFKKTRLVTENESMMNALSMFKIGG